MKKYEHQYLRDLMNGADLTPLTTDFDGTISMGMLIGFKGLGEEKGITAAYPVWSFIPAKKEIQFILFWSSKNGAPCIDNTWLTSHDLYINKEPIKVELF